VSWDAAPAESGAAAILVIHLHVLILLKTKLKCQSMLNNTVGEGT